MDYLEPLVLILQMLYVYRLLIVAFLAKWIKNTSRGAEALGNRLCKSPALKAGGDVFCTVSLSGWLGPACCAPKSPRGPNRAPARPWGVDLEAPEATRLRDALHESCGWCHGASWSQGTRVPWGQGTLLRWDRRTAAAAPTALPGSRGPLHAQALVLCRFGRAEAEPQPGRRAGGEVLEDAL